MSPSAPQTTKPQGLLSRILAEPATRGMDLDDPATTEIRRDLAKTKRTLALANAHWYGLLQEIDKTVPAGLRVELGSGGGQMDEYIPNLVKTDLLALPFVDVVCGAEHLPYAENSISAIYMINVLHHVLDAELFFTSAAKVLRPGGVVAMIEPTNTDFARLIYTKFHHEPFDLRAREWKLADSGPLSGGNQALPWLMFVRDAERFRKLYRDLSIESVEQHTPLSRLLSGGVLARSLVPAPLFPLLQRFEQSLPGFVMRRAALFQTVVIRKRGDDHGNVA